MIFYADIATICDLAGAVRRGVVTWHGAVNDAAPARRWCPPYRHATRVRVIHQLLN